MAEWILRVFHQSTHARVASSTSATLRHGPRRYISSALYKEFTASANALKHAVNYTRTRW